MNRMNRLNDLVGELRKFYLQEIDEETAFNDLENDLRFEGWLKLGRVKAIYKRFKQELDNPGQPQLDAPPAFTNLSSLFVPRFPGRYQALQSMYPFYNMTFVCEHEIQPCLRLSYGYSPNARFVFYHIRSKPNHDVASFLLRDMFSNKDRYITMGKEPNSYFNGFFFLNDNFGLLLEKNETAGFSSLVEMDWTGRKMRKIQTDYLLPKRNSGVLIDSLDSSQVAFTFATIGGGILLHFYNIGDNEIVLESAGSVAQWPGACVNSIFDGTLYGFEHSNLQTTLRVNRLEPDSETSIVNFEWPSNGFHVLHSVDNMVCCWVRDRFYAIAKLDEIEKFGIAWASHKTRKWTLIKFSTVERIIKMQFIVENSILLVQTVDDTPKPEDTTNHRVYHTFYRIPLKKPDSLSTLAWCSLVQAKGKLNFANPYEEARRYLPLTSEIQYPFDV